MKKKEKFSKKAKGSKVTKEPEFITQTFQNGKQSNLKTTYKPSINWFRQL